ncbi:hypothetical protein Jab_2c00160 [Janthinobacterium sp. HH01]|uniref:hypothetical protein n=1 Tax=Janthinobacterium sp. HH01 TaxID=1198452 RepID=UPI0002AE7F62|nr:hypothetical protein [Janthinobacterium sp. HH01]ELX07975.1 hypothetical protein Jab_2c00160 [Janthinobacterium sp. HH01]
MMKPISYLIPLFAVVFSISAHAGNSTKAPRQDGTSSSRIEVTDDGGVATIRGMGGTTNILGDKVELLQGIVYLNGRSYGTVPSSSEIKYVVTKTARTLYVDGKPRSPVAK